MRICVTPAKCAYVAEQTFLVNVHRNLSLMIECKYRSGEFSIDPGVDPIQDDDEFYVTAYPENEMCFLSDRLNIIFDFSGAPIKEEERLLLISGFEMDGISRLEELGWESSDRVVCIFGSIKVAECLLDKK